MKYLELLRKELPKPSRRRKRDYQVLDLFAGCGGLALGFEAAGFHTTGYEMQADACETYRRNLAGECYQKFLLPNEELIDHAEVIIGGPPCQPFSVGGLQQGKKDKRDGFPVFVGAVERYQPEVFVFENVRGMLYRNREYFDHVVGSLRSLGYLVEWRLCNAVDYGVPQKRERLFVVGHRGEWQFPEVRRETAFTAGDAVGDIAFDVTEESRFLTESMDRYVAKYEKKSFCVVPRDLHLDRPARTVTCRNMNGATGDMHRILLPDGRRKRLTVREGARLQSFPDWFEFAGAAGSQFNQVGNAVPPLLAKVFANATLRYLKSKVRFSREEIDRKNAQGQLVFNFND